MFFLQVTNQSGVSTVLFIGTMGMLVLTVGLVLFIIFHQRKVSRYQRTLQKMEEEQQKIFAPFYRGQNVEHIVGSGLGLAVVEKCLELHQGKITVESETGVGTVFTVTINNQANADEMSAVL